MKRLHTLTAAELNAWRQERMRIGQQTYGDRDTGRYNLVDVVEELLDVLNILERFENRAKVQGYELTFTERQLIKEIRKLIDDAMVCLMLLDEELPDRLCADENGGERIWWK